MFIFHGNQIQVRFSQWTVHVGHVKHLGMGHLGMGHLRKAMPGSQPHPPLQIPEPNYCTQSRPISQSHAIPDHTTQIIYQIILGRTVILELLFPKNRHLVELTPWQHHRLPFSWGIQGSGDCSPISNNESFLLAPCTNALLHRSWTSSPIGFTPCLILLTLPSS